MLLAVLIGSVISTGLTIQPSFASHNIIIDSIDDEYQAGDTVDISGTIDNVDDSEDEVTIRIDGADSESEIVTLDDDDFSWDYDIPDPADDGIYFVEVEYDGESVFTYFFVDDNSDLDVVTDKDTYELGENVEITGEVNDPQLDPEEVEITVYDPSGGTVLGMDEEGVNLEGDAFETDFDLDDDEDAHGIYAVLVTYNNDDDEEGYVIFEVVEEGGSSGSTITASLSKTTYKQGEKVTITGEVENKEGNDDVVLVVKDSDDDEIVDEAVEPDTDGSFEFEFTLEDDAKTGAYEATLSYIQVGNEKVLLFSVTTSTSGGGGSSGGGSGSSEGLTAKLNKVSYLAGETMTITGVVPSLEEDPVNIVILSPGGEFTGSSAFPEPESDKSYSATLRLKSDLEAEDDYEAVITYDNKEVTIKFDITGTSSEGALTVRTDKESYSIGSTVKITGRVDTDELGENQKVLIRAFNPDEEPYRYDLVDLSSDGSYTYSMVVGGDLAKTGEWQVLASYNQEEVETSFQLGTSSGGGGPPDDATTFNLRVNDRTYPIEYELSDDSGQVEEMIVNYAKKKLVISIDSDAEGELTIVLPRDLIDSSSNGTDRDYVVTTRDNAVGDDIVVDFEESENDDESRTLVIEYGAGTDIIEIAGTTIVPEFGLLSAVILAVAIVGIIAATKFSNGLHFRRW
jgi:predicted secreted protein with PEFG-CTERM motif